MLKLTAPILAYLEHLVNVRKILVGQAKLPMIGASLTICTIFHDSAGSALTADAVAAGRGDLVSGELSSNHSSIALMVQLIATVCSPGAVFDGDSVSLDVALDEGFCPRLRDFKLVDELFECAIYSIWDLDVLLTSTSETENFDIGLADRLLLVRFSLERITNICSSLTLDGLSPSGWNIRELDGCQHSAVESLKSTSSMQKYFWMKVKLTS